MVIPLLHLGASLNWRSGAAYTKESEKKTRELLRLSSAIREAAVLEEDDELLMDAFDGFDSDDEE